ISPDERARPARADGTRRLGPCRSTDTGMSPVDGEMGFVAKHGKRDHGQWRPVLSIAHLATDLERPAGIGILLGCPCRFVGPDLLGRFALFDRLPFLVGIALLWRRHQAGIDNLA